jgi:hypothetical protein
MKSSTSFSLFGLILLICCITQSCAFLSNHQHITNLALVLPLQYQRNGLVVESLDFDECCNSDDEMSQILRDELDLEREKTRLESFEAYVLVSILAASSSFSVINSFSRDDHSEILYTLTLVVAGFSALCSLHSTIVFSLSVLYGKTCLGLQKDVAFHDFLDETQIQRMRGFLSFSAGLLSFALEVGLVLVAKMPEHSQNIVLVGTIIPLGFILSDWSSIVGSAGIIFAGREEDDKMGVLEVNGLKNATSTMSRII